MSNLKKDILFGAMFLCGIFGFISGEFIFSTLLFGTAAMLSNISLNQRTIR